MDRLLWLGGFLVGGDAVADAVVQDVEVLEAAFVDLQEGLGREVVADATVFIQVLNW